MKSDFLKKIIAVAVVSASIGTFMPTSAFAVGPSDSYNWQSYGYWQQYSGKWYYYNYSGTMQTGWIYDKGQWYYLDSNGVMQTGVVQVNGKIYLLSESGAMQTGHAVINGQYYSFDENGAAVGKNVPTPTKGFDVSGVSARTYTPSQVIDVNKENSSPSNPKTVARDPDNLIKYTVKFKDDDGDDLRTSTIEKDDKITLYKPTKSGYKFVEWTTKKSGSGKSYDSGDSITIKDDLTLYAQWEENTSSSTTSTDTVLVEDITVTGSASTITTTGGSVQMSAKVLPIDATNSSVTWSVDDSTIASISSSGLLTAKANGIVSVSATASDGSKVVGKANITITGQTSSGTTTNTGGSTTTGGTTTTVTGGTITAFDPNVKLDDVTINTAGNIVDLPLLKASGKLPTTAKVTCSLSDGTVKDVEMPIKDWANSTSTTFDGTTKGTYTLKATLGDLPTGYTKTSSATIPTNVILNVMVETVQTDARKEITGLASAIVPITLDLDKHIVTTDALNASGILPKTVSLNWKNKTGTESGTVAANVNSWSCTNADNTSFDGSTGIKNLKAELETPVGYTIPSTVSVTTTLAVNIVQTKTIQEIVDVVKNADISDSSKKLLLSYASGDALKLSNLTVNVKYNDGTSGQISYADFAKNNITTPGYFDGMLLSTSNSTTLGIPVSFNSKKVYTEPLTVANATSPTITADGTATYSITTPSAVTFNYDLGTGSSAATGIATATSSVTLNGTALTSGIDYTIDTTNKKLTIAQSKLAAFISSKTTPSTYALKVTFATSSGTNPTASANIHFINTPAAPSSISFDTPPAKDKTIKLSNLTTGVTYEYCAGTVENWTSAKYFTATAATKELTDTSFVNSNNLYIRVKSISDGMGAVNPASDSVKVGTLNSTTNIGRTLSSEKSITAFSLGTYVGTITESTSSGKIKVIVPTDATPAVMDVSNLTATFTLSDATAKARIGGSTGTLQVSGTTPNNFTNTVRYTIVAEDGTTKYYDVDVIKTGLQTSNIRPDTLQKTVTVAGTDGSGNATTTTTVETFNFFNEYTSTTAAALAISVSDGIVTINVPSTFTTGTSSQSEALDGIKEWTPYMKDKDPQSAYVGMKFTNPYTNAASVKVAASLDDLKNNKNVTTVQLSSDGMNALGGQYLEQIPVAKFGIVSAGVWSKFVGSSNNTTKYYAWIDSSGTILGYTSLIIKVQ